MGALALLRGDRYEMNPGNEFSAEARPMGVAPTGGFSTGGMPQTQPEQPRQPNALSLVPDGAEEAMPQSTPPQAMGQTTAMTVASLEDQSPRYPEWFDDEQKKLYERGRRIRQNYQKAVDLRRQRRRADREYSKLYNTFEKNKEAHDRLEHFQKEYPDMFRPDDPRTLGMIRQQMIHLNEAKTTRDKLVKMLQQNGVKLGPKGQIPDSLYGDADDEDRKFDQFAKQGLMDAMFPRDDDN